MEGINLWRGNVAPYPVVLFKRYVAPGSRNGRSSFWQRWNNAWHCVWGLDGLNIMTT